jgi:SAM-dependent methyltransferase
MIETIDHAKLQEFAMQVAVDASAAAAGALVVLGDRLGLYQAIAENGPVTPDELAHKTGLRERYLREWLAAQAASGYVNYDVEAHAFSMSPEQVAVFTDESCPAFMPGCFQAIAAMYLGEPQVAEAFRSGHGVGWAEHAECLFCGVGRAFGSQYQAYLTETWIPALDGVPEKLQRGAKVADIGCGHGVSTVIMAKAFPQSEFIGYDYHELSIDHARALAEEEGLNNVRFDIAEAKSFPGADYDLITMFDCLHDLGDPVGAAHRARQALAKDGTLMIVEPLAGNQLADNLNPVGRYYYSASTMFCVPGSLSQEGAAALGAQAGEARLRAVLSEAGFSHAQRVGETMMNMVLEARL